MRDSMNVAASSFTSTSSHHGSADSDGHERFAFWEQRYQQFEPELEGGIKEVMSLVPDDSSITASTERLLAMERRAFALVRERRREDARDVLFSQEYEGQNALYAEGITNFWDRFKLDSTKDSGAQERAPFCPSLDRSSCQACRWVPEWLS